MAKSFVMLNANVMFMCFNHSLYVGNRLVVVLNDYKAIHEALVQHGDVFSARPAEFINSFPVDDYPSRYQETTFIRYCYA